MAWFFVAALFCDGANLDDLFSDFVVLHDDDEAGATASAAYGWTNGRVCWEQHNTTGTPEVRQSPPFLRSLVRVIIDQDSPSLTADGFHAIFNPLRFLKDSSSDLFFRQLPTELLHIRFHSLLI